MSELNTPFESTHTRGEALKLAAGAAIGLSLTGRILNELIQTETAKAATLDTQANHKGTTAYAPSWGEYNGLENQLNIKDIGRVIISFAVPGVGATESSPTISSSLSSLTHDLYKNGSEVMLAVGGWGVPTQNWVDALGNPKKFVKATKNAMAELGAETGAKFSGVDLDFEYPSASQANALVKLVKQFRTELPDKRITMAIPASGSNLAGFSQKLTPLIDSYHVMTYDQSTPWDGEAGDIAPGPWVINNIHQAVRRIGDPKKVIAGFPSYGYEYVGAKHRGASFNHPKSQSLQPIHLDQITSRKDSKALSSEGFIGKNWVSFDSPAVIHAIASTLHKQHPSLGGSFYWRLDYMTRQHQAAVKPL
jgi:Glycosyl hydrolases family 18